MRWSRTRSLPYRRSVSAAQISQIVQAQVEAGQAGQLTRDDVEDLVAQAVEGAVGDQLSADDVKAIVDSSLMATNEAIEQAAMKADEARLTAHESCGGGGVGIQRS